MPEGVVVIGANASDEESEGEDSATEVSSIIKPAAHETASPSNTSSPSVPSHPYGIARADGFQSPIAPNTRQGASAGSSTQGVQQQQQQQHSGETGSAASTPAPMVNYTPLPTGGGSYPNVNPALNMAGTSRSDVRVLNVLDVPPAPSTLEQFQVADSGLLEGLPGTMFDWRKLLQHLICRSLFMPVGLQRNGSRSSRGSIPNKGLAFLPTRTLSRHMHRCKCNLKINSSFKVAKRMVCSDSSSSNSNNSSINIEIQSSLFVLLFCDLWTLFPSCTFLLYKPFLPVL